MTADRAKIAATVRRAGARRVMKRPVRKRNEFSGNVRRVVLSSGYR
jgi:hypothetical protein